MQEEQNRIVAILPANANPLIDTTDLREQSVVDSVHRVDHCGPGQYAVSVRTKSEAAANEENDKYKEAKDSEP